MDVIFINLTRNLEIINCEITDFWAGIVINIGQSWQNMKKVEDV